MVNDDSIDQSLVLGVPEMTRLSRLCIVFLPLAAVCLIDATGTSRAQAFGSCVAPTAPAVPAAFVSDLELESWSATVEQYTRSSAAYLRCLRQYAAANEGWLSSAQQANLRNEAEAVIAELRSVSESWNGTRARFLTTK